jgi:hypothetical protein
MTEARLLQVFKTHGLTQVNPINNKFDPNEHEAVMQKVSTTDLKINNYYVCIRSRPDFIKVYSLGSIYYFNICIVVISK